MIYAGRYLIAENMHNLTRRINGVTNIDMISIKTLTLSQQIGSHVSYIHPVIIFNESDLILCDTGYPNQAKQIDDQLKKYGFSVQDITKIIITHHDHDHTGSLSELQKLNPRMTVLTSAEEVPFIEDQTQSLRLLQAEEYNKKLSGPELVFGTHFANYLRTIPSAKVNRTVKHGDFIIEGLKVISTPGHTPGHISLFCMEEKALIAGDALAIENNRFDIANPEFTLDMEECINSIKKILDLNPKKVICYHGETIEDHVEALLNETIARYHSESRNF